MVLTLIRSGQSLLIPALRVRTMAAVTSRGKHTLPDLPYAYDVSFTFTPPLHIPNPAWVSLSIRHPFCGPAEHR